MNMSVEQLTEQLEALKTENTKLKTANIKPLRMKVSEKGGLSVYGLGRFPVTLYKSQWLSLIGYIEQVKTFITENEATLKVKE